MDASEKFPIVLIAAKEELVSTISDALANAKLELLFAQTKHEVIALLQGLKGQIDLAIVQIELENVGNWDLITELTRIPRKVEKVIATTSLYPERTLRRLKGLGVDITLPKGTPPKKWRKTVEAVLLRNESSAS
jgi:CheY-like chemotaxis protein